MSASPSLLSRRRFLLHSTLFTTTLCTAPLWAAEGGASSQNRKFLNLNGAWRLRNETAAEWLPATVPGCVHTDLMAAGKIPDPFFRDNEKSVQWVTDAGWIYQRTFDVPADVLQFDRVLLRCGGLDTLAVVKVNGHELGRPDNMFRTWEFDVKPVLQAGANTVEVTFASPMPYIKERQAGRKLYEWSGPLEPTGRAWVRKEPCNFGWDWAPILITCGIWRDIGLVAFNQARLTDVRVLQDHSRAGKVTLQIDVSAETVRSSELKAVVSVKHAKEKARGATVTLAGGQGSATIEINNPKIWWPAGMGAQPLYDVTVDLRNGDGETLDRTSRRVGLRELRLLPADDNNSLRFQANGITFFAKGANLIPADPFANRVTAETLRRLAVDAVAVNMNSLRFWGGGYYEDDALFDACDELGLCVWLDFKFACSAYPAFDDSFLENVRQEARDQIRRLRHHPCIAVWCGNNEIGLMTKDEWSDQSMGRADYEKLFKKLLGGLVSEMAPQANYVTGSPDCGDVHNWKVWHGGAEFEEYRKLTGFMSEFGFQSFPDPKTVRAYTDTADRENILTPVMKWHERSGTAGLEKIRDMIPNYFKVPADFENILWMSQIVHAYGIKIGAEHWRRTMPKSMGCMFWQYNDCWPVASWSSVDYFGRWKALHYLARRFYAPVLVSALENPADGSVEVHVTSDLGETYHGKLIWNATDTAGTSLEKGAEKLEVAPRQSRLAAMLKLDKLIASHGAGNILVWLKLEVQGEIVSVNLATFARPKDLALQEPGLKTHIGKSGKGYAVTFSAQKPALWCWLDLPGADAGYSDNFFHVEPDRPVHVTVTPRAAMDEAGFRRSLRVRSVVDLS